jgi:hypothetical protein
MLSTTSCMCDVLDAQMFECENRSCASKHSPKVKLFERVLSLAIVAPR